MKQKKILLAAMALAVLIIGGLAMLSRLERSLVFFPTKYPVGNWNPPNPGEDVFFASRDGTRLHGWFYAHPNPVGHLLFCHGNGGNLSDRYEMVQRLLGLGVSVFIFDYRGYGRSDGEPDGGGVMEDAEAARRWLAERVKVPEERLILFGSSLGGAVAVHLAAKGQARGLILEGTFSSLPDVGARLYPYLPARLIMRYPMDSEKTIKAYKGPVFQSHGDRDTVVAFELGQKLHAAIPGPKRFLRLEGLDHHDALPEFYWSELGAWIRSLP